MTGGLDASAIRTLIAELGTWDAALLPRVRTRQLLARAAASFPGLTGALGIEEQAVEALLRDPNAPLVRVLVTVLLAMDAEPAPSWRPSWRRA